jgi:predicted Rossmann fold nucleotide-binding protein DprA/Smf involved in DNA uptake
MRTNQEKRIDILKFLNDNLDNAHPQLVGIEVLADKLHSSLQETKQLLLQMNGMGIIKSGMEGRYSMITVLGLEWLKKHTH